MDPIYTADWDTTPDATLARLMALDWVQVTEARKEFFMSASAREYTYGSGQGRRTYRSSPYTPEVLDIQRRLNEALGAEFNVCFLNRYDDQFNQLGWHADDSPEMDQSNPIAVVSYGAAREIWWRPQDFKGVVPAEWRQLLGHGSLFLMPAGFQDGYQHRIPKCDRACGVRVSLTFRKYAAASPQERP